MPQSTCAVYLELNTMKTTMLMVALLGSALMAQDGPLANGVYAVEEGNAKERILLSDGTKAKTLCSTQRISHHS